MHTVIISATLKDGETDIEKAVVYTVETHRTEGDEPNGRLLETVSSENFTAWETTVYRALELSDIHTCEVIEEWEEGIVRQVLIECYAMAGDVLSRPDAVDYYDVSVLNIDTSPCGKDTIVVEEFDDMTLEQASLLLTRLEKVYNTDAEWIDAS